MHIRAEVRLNPELVNSQIENSIGIMLRMMMEDTHRFAEPITPKKSGILRTEVTKIMDGNTRAIMRWHAPYAAVQEQGYRTDPRTGKIVYFRNYTTPGTHAGFVEEALEKVSQNLSSYAQMGGLL